MAQETTSETNIIEPKLQLVAWEITRSCNLYCAHCRASANCGPYENELAKEECYRVVDEITQVGRPIIIMTGGEPLLRKDLFPIAKYAVSRGLRVVMGTNGTLVTPERAVELNSLPMSRIAISIDFPTAELEDKFRGKEGAFAQALKGIKNARNAGMEVQINSTVTKLNAKYLNDLVSLALQVKAVAFHPFLLVPTGRGEDLKDVELSGQEYEETLSWIYDKQIELGNKLLFKPTDAPHFMRITAQKRLKEPESAPPVTGGKSGHPSTHSLTRGCLAGVGFCFISHQGKVQGCGYLSIEAGDLRKQSFGELWNNSPLFRNLRNLANIKGKCGACEFKRICGGCRARAYEATGDYLEAEPYCVYKPTKMRQRA